MPEITLRAVKMSYIEIERYRNVTEDEIICEYFELNEVENKIHFILYSLYNDI